MKNLKILRFLKGYSQQDLADRLRCSKSKISALETGHRTASIEMLNKCARVLEVDIGVLMGDMCLIPVPLSWGDIYKDVRKRTIIDRINAYDSKALTRVFDKTIERMNKSGGTHEKEK